MTRTLDSLAAAHLAYVNKLRAGGHECCEDYIGRTSGARLYAEMDSGIAFSAMGKDGAPKHWFVADDEETP